MQQVRRSAGTQGPLRLVRCWPGGDTPLARGALDSKEWDHSPKAINGYIDRPQWFLPPCIHRRKPKMTPTTVLRTALVLTTTLLVAATAHAQLFRAYLAPSPLGNDANPCTLPAPCRLLPAALTAVASGGEIWMLDSANYNTAQVEITKSVTILAVPGAVGSVVSTTGGNALRVGVAGLKVALRNLVIVPLPGTGGVGGIAMPANSSLTIENCLIANLPGAAVRAFGGGTLRITDSTLRDNLGGGIVISNGVRGTITRATVSGNGNTGIFVYVTVAGTDTVVDIADSTISGSGSDGFNAFVDGGVVADINVSIRDSRFVSNGTNGVSSNGGSGGAPVNVTVSNNIIANNNNAGIVVYNVSGRVMATGNTISGNNIGLWNTTGLLETAGNNTVRNNAQQTNGTITTVPQI